MPPVLASSSAITATLKAVPRATARAGNRWAATWRSPSVTSRRTGPAPKARANLDVAAALAWVMIAVAALIAVEYGLVHPIRSEFERWREAARPWGVKR